MKITHVLAASRLPLAAWLAVILVDCWPMGAFGAIVSAYAFVEHTDGQDVNPTEDGNPVVRQGSTSASAIDFGIFTGLGGSGAAAAKVAGAISPSLWQIQVATSADARRTTTGIEAHNAAVASANIQSDIVFSSSNMDFPSTVRMHYWATGGPLTVEVTNGEQFQTYGEARFTLVLQSGGVIANNTYRVSNDNGIPHAYSEGFSSESLSSNGEFSMIGYLDIPLLELDSLTRFASVQFAASTYSFARILDRNPDRLPVPDGLEISVVATSDFSHTVRPLGFTLLDGTPIEDVGITYQYVVDTAAVPEPASLAIWGLGAVGCAIAGYRRRQSQASAFAAH